MPENEPPQPESKDKNPGADFLKRSYNLHSSPEAEWAARRTERLTGRKVPQNPEARIQNYLNRLTSITEEKDPHKKERSVQALKRVLLGKFVTKVEDIPQSYWKSQENILRERGQQGDYNSFPEEEKNKWKKELSEGLLDDQRASLEQWIDYFVSDDGKHIPDYLKYWVFRSVTGLSEYDKEKGEFPKRSKGTIGVFPDINYEALSYVSDMLMKQQGGKPISFGDFEYDLKDKEKQDFQRYLTQENFARLYGFANELIKPIAEHLLPVTEGKWVKYAQNTNHMHLVQSIRGRGTGWCTAGENTARIQLQKGDFHVYYTIDDWGRPTVPRIAIRMQDNHIAEVRGIAHKQNLDPFMGDVLGAKLDEFPDKEQYLKKERDMKQLTEIDKKTKKGEALGKEDLTFLYEIDTKIQGFGYQRDPRIKEVRNQRNQTEDMLILFDCTRDQIATNPSQINHNTKAYVGLLTPGIFDKLPKTMEHIYTSFPEGRIRRTSIKIGGKSPKELKRELEQNGIKIYSFAEDMMQSPNFTTSETQEELDLVQLNVGSLGIPAYPTTGQVYKRAEELDLALCPSEVGPQYGLQCQDKLNGELLYVGMEKIASSRGKDVFDLGRYSDGLWLSGSWTDPDAQWDSERRFMFRLGRSSSTDFAKKQKEGLVKKF